MSTTSVPTPEADRIRELEAKVEALSRFKSWVHAYLDGVYVPYHPPGPHGRDGCRVGDRLHWLMTRLYAAEGERDRLRAALDPLREQLQKLLNAGTKYSRCALYLDSAEAEALARAALGEE